MDIARDATEVESAQGTPAIKSVQSTKAGTLQRELSFVSSPPQLKSLTEAPGNEPEPAPAVAAAADASTGTDTAAAPTAAPAQATQAAAMTTATTAMASNTASAESLAASPTPTPTPTSPGAGTSSGLVAAKAAVAAATAAAAAAAAVAAAPTTIPAADASRKRKQPAPQPWHCEWTEHKAEDGSLACHSIATSYRFRPACYSPLLTGDFCSPPSNGLGMLAIVFGSKNLLSRQIRVLL